MTRCASACPLAGGSLHAIIIVMKRYSLTLVTLLASMLIGLPAHAAKVVAEIGPRKITLKEFEKKYQENLKFYGFKKPSKVEVLNDLVKREIAVQEAKKLGLDKDPEVKEKINTVLFQALVNRQFGEKIEKIHVSDGEAKGYYSRNPEIRTSHIFVPVPPNANPEQEKAAKKRINEVLALVQKKGKNRESFAEIAQRESEGIDAALGGDIDFQTKNSLDPAYWDAARRLKKGQVSPPVRTEFGYHIIRLTDVKPWSRVDRAKVKRMVFEEKRNQLFEGYISGLRKKYSPKVNSAQLR